MQTKNNPLQKELVLGQPNPAGNGQGAYSLPSSSEPASAAVKRIARHPLNQAFGDLSEQDRKELTECVRRAGQVREIFTLHGRILTDWEFYNVALDLDLPVRIKEFEGNDPVAFLAAHHLRHPRWDHGQRAVIAVRLYAWREPGRPENPVRSIDLPPGEGGPDATMQATATTAEMAEAAQVSPTLITRAKRVHEMGLSEAVISGELKITEAYRRVRLVCAAGLADAALGGEEAFDGAFRKAQVLADAGFLQMVKTNKLNVDAAWKLALAGETGQRVPARRPPLTKAQLAKRLTEAEDEIRVLVRRLEGRDPEHSDMEQIYRQFRSRTDELRAAETRAERLDAEVTRLTGLLRHAAA